MTDDPQDLAEALDEDKIGEEADFGGDELGDGQHDFPPDRPLGANTVGVTPVEEDAGESLEERTWREEPDPALEEVDGVARDVPGSDRLDLVEADVSTEDREAQQTAEMAEDEAGPEAAALHIESDDSTAPTQRGG